MSISKSRGSYIDCYSVLDQALSDDSGVRVGMDTYDACVHFRMRLQMARSINRRDNAEIYEPGDPLHNASPYDRLVVRLKNREARWWVYVEHIGLDLGEIQPLSQVLDDLHTAPQIEGEVLDELPAPEAPKLIEHLRRRV